ncbi:MAG: alanyl-tRNA editing protein [Thermomicrobiales bacterium]
MSDQATGDVPATELLYHTDAYARSIETTVSGVDPETRGIAVAQTIIYPGGGGQPHDTGRISAGDRSWTIVSAKKVGPVVWHYVDGDSALPEIGDVVQLELDWDHRYRLMRTHTALHVLCGTIFRDYGALVTGGNMGPTRPGWTSNGRPFNPDLVAEIERVANEEIASGRETRVRILPREEAFQIPDLIRTKINLLPEGSTRSGPSKRRARSPG